MVRLNSAWLILSILLGFAMFSSEVAWAQGPGTETEVWFQADGTPLQPVMATRRFEDLWTPIQRVRSFFDDAFPLGSQSALLNWNAGAIAEAKQGFLSQHLNAGEDSALFEAAFYVHTILRAVALLPKDASDPEIEMRVASLLNGVASTDAEKLLILQILSVHLNETYNDHRNPGQGTTEEQDRARDLAAQKNVPFSAGDLSLMQILRAAGLQEPALGGVCNDNAEALAKLASKIFPSQDTLVINQGGHFALALYDGKTIRILDGSRELESKNVQGLFPSTRTPNLRINQIRNGKLVQIANVSTATGALVDRMTGENSPRLETEPVGSRFTGTIAGQGHFRASVGTQSSGSSRLTLILGQYEKRGRHSDFKIALGGGATTRVGEDSHFQGVFQVSYRYSRILVLRPKFELASDSSVRLEGFGTWFNGADEMGPVSGLSTNGISGELSVRNGLRLKSEPAPGLMITGMVMIEHDLGSASWGDSGGASAILDGPGIRRTLSFTRFLFNQDVVRVQVLKKLTSDRALFIEGSYQGSNVGQVSMGKLGVEQRMSRGVGIRAYGGYLGNAGGYRTKNSLLYGPEGGMVGVELARRNLSAGALVYGISKDQTPMIQVRGAIRLGWKKRKATPHPVASLE